MLESEVSPRALGVDSASATPVLQKIACVARSPGVLLCLVLLNQYWGIVTVPGSFLKAGDLGWPDPHPSP